MPVLILDSRDNKQPQREKEDLQAATDKDNRNCEAEEYNRSHETGGITKITTSTRFEMLPTQSFSSKTLGPSFNPGFACGA